MKNYIREFIKLAISELIKNTSNEKKIKKSLGEYKNKIHFIPTEYRIFGGLLQSMNIQFGNFIEKLLHKIVENEKHLTISPISGMKKSLSYTNRSVQLVEEYISSCKKNNYSNNKKLLQEFNALIDNYLKIEATHKEKDIVVKYDIDLLFSNKNNKFYYLEVKYRDNHDTGKYVDINRKFIRSYLGISNALKVYDRNKFKPILYYLTNERSKGNIYLPEKHNIYRGDRLFKEFFKIDYQELNKFMENIGDDKDIMKLFDKLYSDIRNSNIIS